VPTDRTVEDLLRDCAPQVLGALVRHYGRFDLAEDAVQEALLAAAVQWPVDGVPSDPRPWLIRVAQRKMIDLLRAATARRDREALAAVREPADTHLAPAPDAPSPGGQDDSLVVLFLCCHPALDAAGQVALTLRAVGGLTTAEIARAFFVPEATMAQRISRAKRRIRASGTPFGLPSAPEWATRRDAVLQVLYLVFNEGYTSSSGADLHRVELSAEAIRLTRLARRLLPDDGEVAGLLALMLLTDARRPARTDAAGALVPLAEQDRDRWDRAAIAEGTALVTAAMTTPPLGPYQLQAAIAAVHAEARRDEDTDWPQILALYTLLGRTTDNPVVALNRAVAVAMVYGPTAGMALLRPLDSDPRLAGHHRLDAVRAHLLELAGDAAAAGAHYRAAAGRTTSEPERRYLLARARRMSVDTRDAGAE
jgi:RNA polymerase sigma factor (sigma-70 family)